MFSFKKILTTFIVALPLFCQSQTSLTSLSQEIFYVEKDWDEFASHSLTIYGKNLWPDYMTNEMSKQLVKVYFKKGSQVQEVEQRSGNKSQLTVTFRGSDWLNKIGFIEVYILIDDLPIDGIFSQTNSLYISVEFPLEVPPTITSISPNKFLTEEKVSDKIFRIYGKNMGLEKTTIAYMNGSSLGVAYASLIDGVMDVYIPKPLINTPGTYDVQVKSKYGYSNTVQLVIEKPPLKMTKIIKDIFVKPDETKPANNAATPPITANTTPNSGVGNTNPDNKAGELTANGIKVKMLGNILNAEDRAMLEKYIDDLDNVLIVDNQMKISDNNMNMLFEITGKGMVPRELEKAKTNIEDKLKAMGFSNAVVIIKII